jgi:15-cis-phytoene synthase
MTPAADARWCARLTRRHARTFSLAGIFLPPPKRRAAFALYAFCRTADDIVDRTPAPEHAAAARGQLEALRRRLDDALAGAPADPLLREVAWAIAHYDVPAGTLHALLDGVARDCTPPRYGSWPELERYCHGVASTVGEMCTHIFGVPGGPAAFAAALDHARILGVAMQLTNILRDVGEDARRGRCYLPDDELSAAGLSAERILHDRAVSDGAGWRALMRFEIARARALYAAAAPGMALLAPDARRCATACAAGYAAILSRIEANGYDTIRVRAVPSAWQRARVLVDVWRGAPVSPMAAVGVPPAVASQATVPAASPGERDDEVATWA